MRISDQNLNELKQKLLEEQTRLSGRLLELQSQDPFNDPDRVVDNAASDTEASEESDHDRVEAMTESLSSELKSITKALGRIADSTYGTCEVCGEEIEFKRLSIMPTATQCIKCGTGK